MRAWSEVSTRLFRTRIKRASLTLAAGSLAGLAVLGACADNVSKVTGTRANPNTPGAVIGVVGSNAHKITVCVDPTSDPAPGNADFMFATVADGLPGGFLAWFEDKGLPPDPNFVPAFLAAQNSLGPFPLGAFLSDQVIASVGAQPGECEDVFIRANTCAGGVCGNINPFDHAGNRLWTLLPPDNRVLNPFGAVDITATIPAGYTHTVNCTNDDPTLPQSCTNGGYTSANVFHGSSFTFKFVAPELTGCTVTLGWWKNKGAAISAQFDFDGGTNNGLDVLNTKPKGNPYYILAHQYIAAALNVASGATLSGAALTAFNDATAYFVVASPGNPLPAPYTKDGVTALSAILDDFNNGVIGPGHCDD